jgi:hypothetical protein
MQKQQENKPTNPQLWSQAKSQAKSRFDVYPSAYANAWASRWYKERGGSWKTTSTIKKSSSIRKDLRQWFNEKWVDISKPIRNSANKIVGFEECGSGDKGGYPKCLPKAKANKLSDRERATLIQRKRKTGMPQDGKPVMTSSKINKYF